VLKQLFDYVHRLLLIAEETKRNRDDLEELRQELQRTNELVLDLSHKFERLAGQEKLEREKFSLQLENALLRFEKLLPPPPGARKRKQDHPHVDQDPDQETGRPVSEICRMER
jgi:hypothetical protein